MFKKISNISKNTYGTEFDYWQFILQVVFSRETNAQRKAISENEKAQIQFPLLGPGFKYTKQQEKSLLNIDKNDNWSCNSFCYHGKTRKRTLGFAAHVQECGFSSFPLLGNID